MPIKCKRFKALPHHSTYQIISSQITYLSFVRRLPTAYEQVALTQKSSPLWAPSPFVFAISVFTNFKTVITIEDGTITGGLAGVVALYKAKHNFSTKLISLGVPDRFISHGTISELKTECGFDKESIEKVIRETIA